MARYRIWLTSLLLLGLLVFWPSGANSRQYFDAEMKFNPQAGTNWHYLTYINLSGNEIKMGKRDRVGGWIVTIYDEEVTSSGNGLVGFSTRFNIYEALDLGWSSEYENPGGGGGIGAGEGFNPIPFPWADQMLEGGDQLQTAGGGGGGSGGSGGGSLMGEGAFEITPIMESNIRYVMSESGRILDVTGLDLIGDIIDPSRSITVRQLFETVHFVVLPDYQVHLNESWRAPMSWTIPFVGETMEIPLTFTLVDIRTTYRFRVAAIDISGILQFDVDVSDEDLELRKESNIQGDIIIRGRAYVDLDRGILVALCDLDGPYFLNGVARGSMYRAELGPGFYAELNFERTDLYTPLGNVIDPRQEIQYVIQELTWFTTTVVE